MFQKNKNYKINLSPIDRQKILIHKIDSNNFCFLLKQVNVRFSKTSVLLYFKIILTSTKYHFENIRAKFDIFPSKKKYFLWLLTIRLSCFIIHLSFCLFVFAAVYILFDDNEEVLFNFIFQQSLAKEKLCVEGRKEMNCNKSFQSNLNFDN